MAEIFTARAGDAITHSPASELDLGWLMETEGDWFESNSYIIVGKDGSLLFIQGLLGSVKPMYTLQPGVHVKYVDPSGKATHHSEKFETKHLNLSDEGKMQQFKSQELNLKEMLLKMRILLLLTIKPLKIQ